LKYIKKLVSLIDSAKYKEAIILFKKAIKIKPDYTEAFNKMALAKLKTQDYKGAEKDLQAAQKILPTITKAKKPWAFCITKPKDLKKQKQRSILQQH
jgi:tetratricopeptide (TPR) repeat protein